MVDFVTYSQFESILTLRVLLGIGIVYLMYQFAIRNPTDYDTPYRRKMRHVYGWICVAGAVGFIFLAVAGPFPYSLPWYYLNLYGTVSPNEDALLYGISSDMIVRAPGTHYVWGRMTFEQWAMCSSISGVLEWAALAVYAFAMKRSSVKWFAKLRKAIGYILLIILPAQINNLHYFDVYELIPLAIYVLVVYLLVRTYRWDNQEPKLPEEAEHGHIQDFSIESPAEAIEPVGEKKSCNFEILHSVKVLWVVSALCGVLAVLFAILADNSFEWTRTRYGYNEWVRTSSSEAYTVWYLIFAIFAVVILAVAILRTMKKVRVSSSNTKALKLFQYMAWSLFAEYVLHILVLLPALPLSRYDFDNLFIFLGVFGAYLCFVRIPCMVYVYNQTQKEGNRFYLIPHWLKEFINSYAESEAPMRAMLAFVMYPLFYLCMFPGGVFALCYLIPAIIIYVIAFFIMWVVRGTKEQVSK